MRVLHRGHRYSLKHRDGNGETIVQYVNKESGTECEGVTQQEVLRMMLDRNRYCTACQPNRVSEAIQYHLQMALVLHEMRALERKVQKGEIMPEYIEQGEDGHFKIEDQRENLDFEQDNATEKLEPYREEWDRPCNHHSGPELVENDPSVNIKSKPPLDDEELIAPRRKKSLGAYMALTKTLYKLSARSCEKDGIILNDIETIKKDPQSTKTYQDAFKLTTTLIDDYVRVDEDYFDELNDGGFLNIENVYVIDKVKDLIHFVREGSLHAYKSRSLKKTSRAIKLVYGENEVFRFSETSLSQDVDKANYVLFITKQDNTRIWRR